MRAAPAQTESLRAALEECFSEGLEVAFTLSDPTLPDNPIVFASDEFVALSGYARDAVLGRNCRFLQGEGTSPQAVTEIRSAIAEDRAAATCLLNYRRDGTPFWNAFYIAPVRLGGELRYYVGLQADVTALIRGGRRGEVEAVAEREAEHAAAVAARLAQHLPALQVGAGGAGGAAAAAAGGCAAAGGAAAPPPGLLCALGKIGGAWALGDARAGGAPVVYASPGFLALSGYACAEVLGRPLAGLLQGAGTDAAAAAAVAAAVAAAPPRVASAALLHYKKDGTPFFSWLHVSPVRDADGCVPYVVAAHVPLPGGGGGGGDAAPGLRQASPLEVLQAKGIVGAVRVAARTLSAHGLRRGPADQHPPC